MAALWIAVLTVAIMGMALILAVCICARKVRVPDRADCIVVLGARVWPDGSPSSSMEYRCRKAAELYRQGLARSIIACGGQGRDEPMPESLAMKLCLMENAVPEACILEDATSKRTCENLRNAHAIMRSHGMRSALIVTSDYHVQRSMWLARDLGMEASFAAALSPKRRAYRIKARVQEAVSWILYFARKMSK